MTTETRRLELIDTDPEILREAARWLRGDAKDADNLDAFDVWAQGLDDLADVLAAELDRRQPTTHPAILDHYAEKHPGEPVDVRVWWDVPYSHPAELDDTGTVLVIDTAASSSGESVGDDEYWCRLCDEILDPGTLDVDYA